MVVFQKKLDLTEIASQGHVHLLDPDAGIGNCDLELAVFLTSRDFDLPVIGELHRVAEQIENDLAQLFTIRIQRHKMARDITNEPHQVLVQHRFDGRRCALNQLIEPHRFQLNLNFAGLDLGKIQQGCR